MKLCLYGLRLVLLGVVLTFLGSGSALAQAPTTDTGLGGLTPASPTPTDTPQATAEPSATTEPSATASATPSRTPTITPGASATPVPLDRYEPDNTQPLARRLVVGESQSRTFYTPEGNDVDWVLVLLKPGRWRLSARSTTATYDPKLTLDGTIVADDSGTSKDAVLEVTVPDETDHLLLVENVGLDGSGQYTLALERVGDPLPATATPTAAPAPGAEDPFEPDAPPHQAAYTGPQLRTFNPSGDQDFLRYRIKAGLRIWVETSDLTGGADTELHIFRDDDGILTEADAWLAGDDDGSTGLGSRVSLQVDADMWLTVLVQNKANAWGPATGYTVRVITAEQATPTLTPTPEPTSAVPPTPRPSYTPYPTYTPPPSPTGTVAPTWTLVPSYTPYPTLTPRPVATSAPAPSNPTSSAPTGGYYAGGAGSEGDKTAAPPAAAAAPAPAPVPPVPSQIRLEVFLDLNGDGLMNWGEEIEDLLVHVTTRDRRWESEAYTTGGEAVIPLVGLPAGKEVVVLVPYLHLSAVVQPKEGELESTIPLALPPFPAYLP